MDRIDALGPRPERWKAFTRELLAETHDAELQRIVEQAAKELGTPIALVTLVLDQIQFFKAHSGLPPDLAASRATGRDVSFCQFVVRDEETFEVTDAAQDHRVPQHLVEAYDIRAYLGVPIRAGDVVVGSLCVIDTEPRTFSAADREALARLGALVDERVTALVERRRQVRMHLAEGASAAALAELRASLAPVARGVGGTLAALAAIRSFLRLSGHVLDGGEVSPDVWRRNLYTAGLAAEEVEETLQDVEAAAADCEDCLAAMEQLTTPAPAPRLSEVAAAAQDLARGATGPVGGAPLPHFPSDPRLQAPRPMAVALVSTALLAIAARLEEAAAGGGIRMRVRATGETVELGLAAEGLGAPALAALVAELSDRVGEDPSYGLHPEDRTLWLAFRVAGEPDAEGGASG